MVVNNGGAIAADFAGHDRSRADQTHTPFHDIEKLRQFIEAPAPKGSCHGRYPGIIAEFVAKGPFACGLGVLSQKFAKTIFRIRAHAPELVAAEVMPEAADPRLNLKDRSALDPNKYRDGCHERQQYDEGDYGEKDVEAAP